MIKADVYSYVHSILSTSRSLAIEVRPRPRLCHRMGALQPRYLHITGVRRAGNRPSKYRSPLFLPLSLSPLFSLFLCSLRHCYLFRFPIVIKKGETRSSHSLSQKFQYRAAEISSRVLLSFASTGIIETRYWRIDRPELREKASLKEPRS